MPKGKREGPTRVRRRVVVVRTEGEHWGHVDYALDGFDHANLRARRALAIARRTAVAVLGVYLFARAAYHVICFYMDPEGAVVARQVVGETLEAAILLFLEGGIQE